MKKEIFKKILVITLIILFITMIMTESFASIKPSDITGTAPGGTELDTSFVEKIVNVIRLVRNIYCSWSNDGNRNKIHVRKPRRKSKLQKINVTIYDRMCNTIWSSNNCSRNNKNIQRQRQHRKRGKHSVRTNTSNSEHSQRLEQ